MNLEIYIGLMMVSLVFGTMVRGIYALGKKIGE